MSKADHMALRAEFLCPLLAYFLSVEGPPLTSIYKLAMTAHCSPRFKKFNLQSLQRLEHLSVFLTVRQPSAPLLLGLDKIANTVLNGVSVH